MFVRFCHFFCCLFVGIYCLFDSLFACLFCLFVSLFVLFLCLSGFFFICLFVNTVQHSLCVILEEARKLTNQATGKHHIGDFLPPKELKKFVAKVKAVKGEKGLEDIDLSDYAEFKLTEENVGYQMLMKAGWTEGSGLGSKGQGITAPINK